MSKNLYLKFELSSAISWLLMDFLWSIGFINLSIIFSIISITLSILAIVAYSNKDRVEIILLIASLSWVLMNSLNLLGDEFNIFLLNILSRTFFTLTLALIIIALLLSRRGGGQVKFNRIRKWKK